MITSSDCALFRGESMHSICLLSSRSHVLALDLLAYPFLNIYAVYSLKRQEFKDKMLCEGCKA